MMNFANAELGEIAIHRVGNKHRATRNFISPALYDLDEATRELLHNFFLKPMKRQVDNLHRFVHTEDVNLNEMNNFAKTIFTDRESLLTESVNILEHLYRQSTHPSIKTGEVYFVFIDGIVVLDEVVSAIGIFKTEQKSQFFQVRPDGDMLAIKKQKGININKLDKGCLILNTAMDSGYRVLHVDNNQYDAAYWYHNFLGLDYVKNENFHTRNYLQLCNGFSEEVVASGADRGEQIKFLSNSVDYFTSNEVFDLEDFTKTVIPEPEAAKEFQAYHETYIPEKTNGFNISKSATKSASRKFKSTIKLDTGIQIKLDVFNPESSRQFMERYYDEDKGMYCYKIFFNEELP